MLVDKKILGKLKDIEGRYFLLLFEKVGLAEARMAETKDHFRTVPGPEAGLEWEPAEPGAKWGGDWITAWFVADYTASVADEGKPLFLKGNPGAEALFFVDGEPNGVFDPNHPVVRITGKAVAGKTYQLALEAYAGHTFPGTQPNEVARPVGRDSRTFGGMEVGFIREDIAGFCFDLRTLIQLVEVLDGNTLRRNKVMKGLEQVFAIVDALPGEGSEDHWRPRLAQAREVMKPLLESVNGPTTPWMPIIGHSHIDTAWLWTLAETWRKCARTFSSMLNLMDQYPELLFIQTAPCHAEKMLELYPSLFERMKAMAAEGRWEPNGAMWLEPDCNIPSGEAFARQLLVGQQFTREHFGYTSNTLWLPDVFGYSAALPQLLKGAKVDYFCTTKIAWNDTTRFPYDTFWWKGIDGTEVVAHYNAIHCWPAPADLTNQWNWVQHKDAQDRRISSFGYGDGGGGPMADMVEMARRCQDLEGCPKAVWSRVDDAMRAIEADLGANLPTWQGELYLEAHRGTLTSVAGIKRGNRKTEFALRETEFLSTLAMLAGASYPQAELLALWKTLLTNQFHDILPGSSIQEVNDEAIATFARCIADAQALSAEALAALGAGEGEALLVANSLSWERQGEVELDLVPDGMAPAGCQSQWVQGACGCPKLVAAGLAIPALGTQVVELVPASEGGASAFRVTEEELETPFAVLKFDEQGRIVSLVDKASGRQVVKSGGALNTFWIGEDLPQSWDNWDVDNDQLLKMEQDFRLISRRVVADGPLQLRLRSEYELGAGSRITQDMVFHSTTPRVDFDTVVDWHEIHKLFKTGFELAVMIESAKHEIQYGHVDRPTHRNLPQDIARFEVCAHKWTDLSEADFGVALLNESKYGISVIGTDARLSLIKSGTHPDPRGDEGRHQFTYSLLPHAAFGVENVVREAYELNLPLTAVRAAPDAKALPGLLTVDDPNVIVEAVKQAESGEGFIVRLYEAGRGGRKARITFGLPVKAVSQTNLLEEEPEAIEVSNNAVEVAFAPFEVKTLHITL